jgi:hypothetical protein
MLRLIVEEQLENDRNAEVRPVPELFLDVD